MDKVCASCAFNYTAKVGENTVCHCKKNGAYIGQAIVGTHWCRHWEDYRNEQR